MTSRKFTQVQRANDEMEMWTKDASAFEHFVEDKLILDSNATIAMTELFNGYTKYMNFIYGSEINWRNDERIKVINQWTFGAKLREIFPNITRVTSYSREHKTNISVYKGIRFINDNDMEKYNNTVFLEEEPGF